jgi:hypothetical protein
MERILGVLRADEALRRELAEHGRRTLLAHHTCAHRVNELMDICRQLGIDTRTAPLQEEKVTA